MANFGPSLVNSRVAQQLSHMSHIAALEAELEVARKQIRMLKKQLGVITRQNEVLKHPWEHMSFFPFASAAHALGWFSAKSPYYTRNAADGLKDLVSQLIHQDKPPSFNELKKFNPLLEPITY